MEKKIAVQIQHDANWKDMLRITAESGFKCVAMGFGSSKVFEREDWEKEISSVGDELAKNGLKCVMTHSPYYDLHCSAEKTDERMEKALLRSMKGTAMLGAELTAVHPRSFLIGKKVHRKKSLEYNLKSFSRLGEEIGKYGAVLGIENMPHFPGLSIPFYSCEVSDHIELVDRLNSESARAVWDLGHSNLMTFFGQLSERPYNQAEAIAALGSRIHGTHIHNNDRVRDLHAPPSLGTIDWQKTLGALKAQGYGGYLTLEVVYDYRFGIESFIKHLYDCAAKLDEIFRKA